MRIVAKSVKGERRLYHIYLNDKPSPLFVSWDRTMGEWDLSTDAEHIMAAHSKGALMRRVEVLADILLEAAK